MTSFVFEVDWTLTDTWTDESAQVRKASFSLGMPPEPFAPVAAPGRCTLTLDNADGRYSPENGGGPLYGKLLPRRPLRIRAGALTLFRGFLEAIQPQAGPNSPRAVTLTAVDAIALLEQARVSLPLQENKRADELIDLLVSAVYTPPDTAYRSGTEVFEVAADRWSADHTSALDAIRECAASEFGRFFIQRDGTPTFLDRRWFFLPADPLLDFTDQPVSLAVERSAETIYNVVNVVAHPRDQVGALTVLARTPHAIRIPPIGPDGPGTRSVRLRFRDGATGQFIGGKALVTPLVPYTDYAINEQADGSGVDYTVSPYTSVTVSDIRGTEATIEFTNSALGPLQVQYLQIRGDPVTRYDPLTETREDSASQTAYQKRTLTLDLPLPDDSTLAGSLADYLLDRLKTPFTRPLRLTVHNRETLDGVNLFSLGLFDTVTVSDTQTRLADVRCWITGIGFELTAKGFTLTYQLERADDRVYFALDTVGHAELDTNTRLAV